MRIFRPKREPAQQPPQLMWDFIFKDDDSAIVLFIPRGDVQEHRGEVTVIGNNNGRCMCRKPDGEIVFMQLNEDRTAEYICNPIFSGG